MLSIAHDGTPEFEAGLARLRGRGAEDLEAVTPVVREILADVRRTGDEAVRRYVEVLERRKPERLVMSPYDGEAALGRLEASRRAALVLAADRITRYHERQRDLGFGYEEEGVGLRMRVRPLARVGVYAPGGKARYPSSVLMTAIPARVAGVRDIVLATPGLGGADRAGDDLLLAAAHLAGVTAILDAGGAHAIAALAYGTASVPRVDKIVGPGNAYVACAKRLVYGEVDIDGIAGPSEVLVVADEGADPALCAADLLAQAEHDEAAYPMMVTTSRAIAEATAREVDLQLETQPRRAIIEASLSRALLLVVADRARAPEVAPPLAPPHHAVPRPPPPAGLERLRPARAVLVGGLTPVAAGDYLAGPSHVLPTGGSVRFGSPLGVYDFVARSSVIRYSREALASHAPHIAALARAEGLEAHARSVELRLAQAVSPRESAP